VKSGEEFEVGETVVRLGEGRWHVSDVKRAEGSVEFFYQGTGAATDEIIYRIARWNFIIILRHAEDLWSVASAGGLFWMSMILQFNQVSE
jgi:hypothetical protein